MRDPKFAIEGLLQVAGELVSNDPVIAPVGNIDRLVEERDAIRLTELPVARPRATEGIALDTTSGETEETVFGRIDDVEISRRIQRRTYRHRESVQA